MADGRSEAQHCPDVLSQCRPLVRVVGVRVGGCESSGVHRRCRRTQQSSALVVAAGVRALGVGQSHGKILKSVFLSNGIENQSVTKSGYLIMGEKR